LLILVTEEHCIRLCQTSSKGRFTYITVTVTVFDSLNTQQLKQLFA